MHFLKRFLGYVHREFLGGHGAEQFILGLTAAVGLVTFFMLLGKAWDLLAEPLTGAPR